MDANLTSDYKKQSPVDRFKNLPQRIFMDTNIVQYINDFSEFIFDNYNQHEPDFIGSKGKKIKKGDLLHNQIQALRQIFFGIERTSVEFAVSEYVYDEIQKKNDYHLNHWFYNLWEYWQTVIETYDGEAFTGQGKSLSHQLQSDHSIKGAFSKKDFKIFCDAIELECDAILTCDKFRRRQSWVYKKCGMMILYPTDFIEMTSEFQALWF